jgi:mRNA interferase MazF
MKRGDLYRVRRPPGDPKPARTFVIVGRQAVINSRLATVTCAPIFSQSHGLPTEVEVGVTEELKHVSAIQCDSLMSIDKARLTDFVGTLGSARLQDLSRALGVALALRPYASTSHPGE